MNSPFTNAMTQLDDAAQIMDLDAQIHERLRHPEKMHTVAIPVMMDDGNERIFTGYRSQYSSALGLYKGGIRFANTVDEDEVKALSFWMAIKTATTGLPLGGGKGGIIVNPRELSEGELERVSRGWVRALFDVIGPDKDVPAPDVATNPLVMKWMTDEYSTIAGTPTPGAFTGKEVADGGIVARGTSTSRGGFFLLEEIRKKAGKKPGDMRVAVQGFGNAGSYFAKLAYDAGYIIVGLSDSRSSFMSMSGCALDPYKAEEVKKQYGSFSMDNFSDACEDHVRIGSSTDVLEVECDVLVPAAIENQITVENAANVKASLIIELANGPTTPDADHILTERDVVILPDVLANAGGVIVSYYEWYQNTHDEEWSESATNEKLRKQISAAYKEIDAVSVKYDTTLRNGAFIHALERIAKAG